MPTVTFTLISGKVKGPTCTFHYRSLGRAPKVRSGNISSGLAPVAGWSRMSWNEKRAALNNLPLSLPRRFHKP